MPIVTYEYAVRAGLDADANLADLQKGGRSVFGDGRQPRVRSARGKTPNAVGRAVGVEPAMMYAEASSVVGTDKTFPIEGGDRVCNAAVGGS